MTRLITKTPIPTRRRMTPVLRMSNPDVFAETANLMMAPTTTSTMPKAMKPMPEVLFIALQSRLHRQLVQGTGGCSLQESIGRDRMAEWVEPDGQKLLTRLVSGKTWASDRMGGAPNRLPEVVGRRTGRLNPCSASRRRSSCP